MPNSGSAHPGTSGVAPTAAEALARLDMPLLEAMMTQRAVRRVLPDPVDDEVVLKCIELALRAPTGANGQNWEFIVVKDPRVKEKLARRYRQAWKCTTAWSSGASLTTTSRWPRPRVRCQWQVDHFTEIPVLVVACLRSAPARGACRSYPCPMRPCRDTSDPSTRACRTCCSPPSYGAGRVPHHLAAVERDLGAQNPQFAVVGDSVLRRATRLAARALRADHPQTGGRGDAPRCVRQPGLVRHLIRLSLGHH